MRKSNPLQMLTNEVVLSEDFFKNSMIFLTVGVEKLASMQFICRGHWLMLLRSISDAEYRTESSLKSEISSKIRFVVGLIDFSLTEFRTSVKREIFSY